MRTLAFGILGCLALCLTSCSDARNPRQAIIGEWEDAAEGAMQGQMEFTKDGEFKHIPPTTPQGGPFGRVNAPTHFSPPEQLFKKAGISIRAIAGILISQIREA